MKILLVCAGGMSTSILMKKMETYWQEHGEELQIEAVGLGAYQDVFQNYEHRYGRTTSLLSFRWN